MGLGKKLGRLLGLPTKEDQELMIQTLRRLQATNYSMPPSGVSTSHPDVIVRVSPTAGLLDVFDKEDRPIGMINTATGEITYAPRQ